MEDLEKTRSEVLSKLNDLSSQFESKSAPLAIILAAGHGKRIKSATSKMLHEIWGEPTVVRVARAARQGLESENLIIVVGIKAQQVAQAVGKYKNQLFAYQQEQNGTGHAVRVALDAIPGGDYDGNIYIFPGDMGLIDTETTRMFRQQFLASGCDMMVLTGLYDGNPAGNYYGRILRVPEEDIEGRRSGDDCGKVIEIKEHKDILALREGQSYRVKYKSRTYSFTRQELIDNCEFNTGVFAFKAAQLSKYIRHLNTDNAQGELYLTDLISLFNANGLSVGAIAAADNRSVIGFNTKSVLREMNDIAREKIYRQLQDVVAFEDQNDFFIAEDVVQQINEFDLDSAPLDLSVGKGAYIGKGIVLSRGVKIGRRAHVSGAVHLGANCRIGNGVTVTGTPDYPTEIGNNVVINGNSNIIGCTVEDDVVIEHSIIEHKTVKRVPGQNGKAQAVRFVVPKSEGLAAISD